MQFRFKKYFIHTLKGMGMGAANIIPGVSGGTIALITGVFERLINALKSFNLKALSLLFKGKIKEFIEYIDLYFLIALGLGMVVSIVAVAGALKYLLVTFPVYVWSFFFGLIVASVYYVARTVNKWNLPVILFFIVGATIAISLSFLKPASANDSFLYLLLCGIVAICSMILPGISGSFVLMLLGNYELVMIDAVTEANFMVLFPVLLGGVIGIIALSNILSWVFKRFRDQTISLLSGFILGSLSILWPWKQEIFFTDALGQLILKGGNPIVERYRLILPDSFSTEVLVAIAMAGIGFGVIALMEYTAKHKTEPRA